MRTLSILAVVLLVTPAAFAAVPSETGLADGLTGFLGPLYAWGGVAFSDGEIRLQAAVYEKAGDAWSQVRKGVVLRVAVYDLAGEHDAYSFPFVSNVTHRVQLSIPRDVVGTQPFDMWLTIHREDGSVSTSHYGQAKNAAILRGQYDVADALDHHQVLNPISLG